MRSRWLFCIVLSSLLLAQTATPPPVATPAAGMTRPTADKPAEPATKPDEPVITVKAPCGDASDKDKTCATVVTREQFEKLAEALQPGMSTPIKLRLANALSKLTAMSQEAEKRGLDKQQRYEQSMRFARMQILSQQLTASLQEEAGKVPDAEIEKYYREKNDSYQEATLQRLYIPVNKQFPAPKPAPGKAAPKKTAAAEKEETERRETAGKTAMAKAAALLRARAAKGENFDTLEKEAYLAAGLLSKAPTTKMEKVRPATLPAAHKSVLDLKPGEVSPLISDASGHYVYKMVSKQTLPLDSVRTEIKNFLTGQRFRDAMQEYQGTTQLNEAYFGIAPKPKPQPGNHEPEPEGEVDPD